MAKAMVVGGEQATWSVAGHSMLIEYSLPVLAQINLAVIAGFKMFRRAWSGCKIPIAPTIC